MQKVPLIRTQSDEHGTLGHLIVGQFHCFTLEECWKENQHNISCILPGLYVARWTTIRGAKFDFDGYELEKVPGRSSILMHSGNTIADTEGCILFGSSCGFYAGTDPRWKDKFGVWDSSTARLRFERLMGHDDFELEILNYSSLPMEV